MARGRNLGEIPTDCCVVADTVFGDLGYICCFSRHIACHFSFGDKTRSRDFLLSFFLFPSVYFVSCPSECTLTSSNCIQLLPANKRRKRDCWNKERRGNKRRGFNKNNKVTNKMQTTTCYFAQYPGYNNRKLCQRQSYIGGLQQAYRNVPTFTRKPLLHPEVAKEMENQS